MRATIILAFALIVIGGVALADEVVHFKNGTEMAVVAHVIRDGMIHVDLGNGEMAFPADQVERIESDDEVIVSAVTGTANRRVASQTHGIVPRTTREQWDAGRSPAAAPEIEKVNGVATVRQNPTGSPAQRRLRLSGNGDIWNSRQSRSTRSGTGPVGTRPVGTRQVISRPGTGSTGGRPQPISASPRTRKK